jgi:hypothetical protein
VNLYKNSRFKEILYKLNIKVKPQQYFVFEQMNTCLRN